MKKLCVFTLYPEKGASSQYRAFIFKEEFENHFDVEWYPFWNDKYVTEYMHNKRKYVLQIVFQYLIASIKRKIQLYIKASKADIVFVQKGVIPKSKKTYLDALKKKNIRIVFDVDDAIYTDPRDNSDLIAGISDCVICGNATLMGHYSQYNNNCIVLPTIEKTFRYEPYWRDTFEEKIIGWIGSKTTIDNFDLIIDGLNELTSRHPEVKIAIISNTALDYTNRINNSYLVPWTKDTYVQEIAKFSIGIMPLKDNEVNRGKCGFKLVQYLNMRKPVVGSGVGVNTEIIAGNGVVANTTEEWVDALEKILYDENFYNKCVKHIDDVFFDTYHFRTVSKTLIGILEGGS